ncbi:uncharacterized protein LY89DRAFT_676539 [Mollisia scopiformis]|uniref:Velvet domain-containing protein n=1 Tax=Mollisia scopiformis TaxID=149040 RepID=A0A132BB02_MOLSC|nr:uncharacterized protein LY89DRAFT_676539 [Mollisia scopiformis]KUJ09179.1 hypothetical protein LY89DRAFT_676539 [Mollisia scopiformis]
MAGTTASIRRSPIPEIITRKTNDGRNIEYHLTVIQQPERARACGSGAKSSADRRPVDPPPVVELRIFSVNGADKEDITFSYSANFFLFATLEVARPMAHGRVQQAAASQQVPVLTGMPVSGMAYLDRPSEAGYFIFPDLSVRHEGLYRLSFNLYEEMRDRDGDAEAPSDKSRVLAGPGTPDASFDWRMEVKSAEFTVFSAKKFPGLAESTALSRTVAEQGCRVRIRRDVRMRRRESKNAGEYEDPAENDAFERGRAAAQDFEERRSRSLSGSPDNRPAYDTEQRRHYQDQYAPSYSASPVAGNAPIPQGGHLGFIGGPSAQYQAPSQPQFAPPQPPAPQAYQPPQQPYHAQGQPPYRPQPAPAPPSHSSYAYDRNYPHSAYASNPPREQRELEPEYRRASIASYVPPSSQIPYPSVDSNYARPPYHGYAPRGNSPPPALAPLKLHSIEPKFDATSPPAPLSAVKTIAPPLPSPIFPRAQEAPLYSQYSAPLPAAEPARDIARNGKRPFDSVFSSAASTKPLHNGMRPSSSHGPSVEEDDEDDVPADLKMMYKRADGTSYSRPLPHLIE